MYVCMYTTRRCVCTLLVVVVLGVYVCMYTTRSIRVLVFGYFMYVVVVVVFVMYVVFGYFMYVCCSVCMYVCVWGTPCWLWVIVVLLQLLVLFGQYSLGGSSTRYVLW